MENTNEKIFIVMHKRVDKFTQDTNFFSLGVGPKKSDLCCDFYDNEGENISIKNPNFCELTGQYWIWKNINSEYIGLMHYRRFFYHPFQYRNNRETPYSSNELKSLLGKYDVILPKRVKTTHFSIKRFKWMSKDFYSFYKNANLKVKDLELTRKIIEKDYPCYLSSFNKVMRSKKIHYANVMVTKKSIYDNYSEFLFGVLFKLEQMIDLADYDKNQARVFGYIGEALVDTYFLNHSEYKIKELPLCNNERSHFSNLLSLLRKVS